MWNIRYRCDELNKRRAAGETLTKDEELFVKEFGAYRTFSQQINYNAKAYSLDYQRYSVKHFAEHAPESAKEVGQEVRERANGIRSNKPASMAEMSVLNKQLGGNIKLKITTDENYKPTPEEIAQGIHVVYVQPGPQDENGVAGVGHAYTVDANGSRIDVRADPNDCFYMVYSMVLASQGTTMSVEQLRQITADAVESNANFSKVLEAEKWVQERYPVDANNLLFSADVIADNKDTGLLQLEDSDIDELECSVQPKQDKCSGHYSQVIQVISSSCCYY